MLRKITVLLVVFAFSLTLGAAPAALAAAGGQVVKIGVVGDNMEQWAPIITRFAKEGISIELVPFADYTLPNQALADKEIDLNAFQHYAFLNKEIEGKKLALTPIGVTIIAPLGLYSRKVHSVREIKPKAQIAIPNDPTNGGRALKLLETAGLIKVRPEAGFLPVTGDITSNPLSLEIIEIEAAQTPRLLDDVTASVINGGHAVDAGLNPPTDALVLERQQPGANNPFINILVARTADKDNPLYKRIVEVYHTDAVEAAIYRAFKGAYLPAWK
jgi:D-methionine transport system substrate-binding protein